MLPPPNTNSCCCFFFAIASLLHLTPKVPTLPSLPSVMNLGPLPPAVVCRPPGVDAAAASVLAHSVPLPTSQHSPPAHSRAGTTALRSSWIRRLKPRDEPESAPKCPFGRDPQSGAAESPGAPLESESAKPSSRPPIEARRTPSDQCAEPQPSSEKPLEPKSSKEFNFAVHEELSLVAKAANRNGLDNCLTDTDCETVRKAMNLDADSKSDGQVDAPSSDTHMVTAKCAHRVIAGAPKPGFGAWINVTAICRGEGIKESEEGGTCVEVPADTENANGKVEHRVTSFSSISGFGPWKNLSSRGRVEEKVEPISGRMPAQFTTTSVPEAAMDSRFCRPQGEDRQKAIPKESSTVYGGTLRSGAIGSSSAEISPGSMGKSPLPPARKGALTFSKVGLPPRPRGQEVQGSSTVGSPIKPSGVALPAGLKDPPAANPLPAHPTQGIARKDVVLDARDANTGHQTAFNDAKVSPSIADTRKEAFFPQLGTCCSSCNYTKSFVGNRSSDARCGNEMKCSVVPSFGVDNCVQTERKIEVRPVKGCSATPASSEQCKLFSDGQVRKSMPPPANIPHAARHHSQFPGKEQTCATKSLPCRNVGSCIGGKKELYEKEQTHAIAASSAFQSISGISQTEPQRPEHLGPLKDIRDVGERKGNLQQQSLLKLKSIVSNSESESSLGTARSDRAEGGTEAPAASASTTASFPWEMVIEAAGSSKRARELFVEVYNRARDELKNQSVCKSRGRVFDASRRLAFGQLSSHCDVPGKPMPQRVQGHQFTCLQSSKDGASKHECPSFKNDVKITDSRINQGDQSTASQQLISKNCLAQGAKQGISGDKVQTQKAGPSSNAHQPGFSSGFFSRVSSFGMYHGLPVEQRSPSIKTQDMEHAQGLREGYKTASAEQKERLVPLTKDGIQIVESSNCGLGLDVHKVQGADVCRQDQRSSCNITLESKAEEKLTERDLGSDRLALSRSSTKEGPTFVTLDKSQEEISFHLGKRSRQIFEEKGLGCCSGTIGKCSAEKSERPVLRPHIWLQRWQSSAMIGRTVPGTIELKSGAVTKSADRLCTSAATTIQDTDYSLPNRNLNQNPTVLSEENHVSEHPHSEAKLLASAAAMAIVGKSSMQFRPVPPQRKGSIAVWPAFGTSAIWNLGSLKDQKDR